MIGVPLCPIIGFGLRGGHPRAMHINTAIEASAIALTLISLTLISLSLLSPMLFTPVGNRGLHFNIGHDALGVEAQAELF